MDELDIIASACQCNQSSAAPMAQVMDRDNRFAAVRARLRRQGTNSSSSAAQVEEVRTVDSFAALLYVTTGGIRSES